MGSVKYVRPEVTKNLPIWALVADCVLGSHAIKNRGDKYLPRPNASDTTDENRARYTAYKDRAVFYNVTGRTLRGLVGEVMKQDPVVEVPPELAILEQDTDGTGLSLPGFGQATLEMTLAQGRAGLLADYPNLESPATRQQLMAGEVRPTVVLYKPESTINWRTDVVGGNLKLTLVVLEEVWLDDSDDFEITEYKQWRVLRLVEGVYLVEIHREQADGRTTLHDAYVPTDAGGNKFDEIPFKFVGAKNNDPFVDQAPLYDLADLNIAHYRNSADYEESCYITGQPTPFISGLTKQWVDEVLKGKVMLGSRAAVPLPEGGSMGLIQASPNSMPFEAMEHKERQMVALGAKLVEQASVQRTATEAGMEKASENSVLSTAAVNVSEAIRQALLWAARFVSTVEPTEDSLVFELNTDLDIFKMDANERAQLVKEWQSGAISFTELRWNLKQSGVAYQEDEDAKEEIDNEMENLLNDQATTGPNQQQGSQPGQETGGASTDNGGAA